MSFIAITKWVSKVSNLANAKDCSASEGHPVSFLWSQVSVVWWSISTMIQTHIRGGKGTDPSGQNWGFERTSQSPHEPHQNMWTMLKKPVYGRKTTKLAELHWFCQAECTDPSRTRSSWPHVRITVCIIIISCSVDLLNMALLNHTNFKFIWNCKCV